MNASNTTPAVLTSVTVAQPGFKGRNVKYRVAAATSQDLLSLDARSAEARKAIADGKLIVRYVRGTDAREAALRDVRGSIRA